MAEMREAKAPEKRGYKKLHHIEIEPVRGENGGHIVTHHFQQEGMEMRKPETHMFGKEDGEALMDHLAKHLKVSLPGEAHSEEKEHRRLVQNVFHHHKRHAPDERTEHQRQIRFQFAIHGHRLRQ